MRGDAEGQVNAESPGAGRAKLRLSRGLSRRRVYGVTPQKSGASVDRESRIPMIKPPGASREKRETDGGDAEGQVNAESPGSGGASPYLSRGLSRRRVSMTSPPKNPVPLSIVSRIPMIKPPSAAREKRETDRVTGKGRSTRKTPAQAELRPTCAGACRVVVSMASPPKNPAP
jgi:hypothetical protein